MCLINRKQRLLKAKQDYLNSLNELLTYLNIPEEKFLSKYQLPDIEKIYLKLPEKEFKIEKSIEIALKNRPDQKIINLEILKLSREKRFYKTLKYPKTYISLYGVRDFKYKEGFKFTINIEYPVNRRKYIGKQLEINTKRNMLEKEKEKVYLEIKRDISNTVNKLNTLKKQIKESDKEVKLVEKLEAIEKEKFKYGASNLFYINQREIYTQKTKLKNLKYKFEYIINYKKYLNILNIYKKY